MWSIDILVLSLVVIITHRSETKPHASSILENPNHPEANLSDELLIWDLFTTDSTLSTPLDQLTTVVQSTKWSTGNIEVSLITPTGAGSSTQQPPPLTVRPTPLQPAQKPTPPPPLPTPPHIHIRCKNNDQCQFDYTCVNKLCLHKCHLGICGENAGCVIKGNNTSCVCPPGTIGNPTLKCTTVHFYEHTALPPIGGPGIPVVDQPINPRTEPPSPRLPPLALTTPRSQVVSSYRPVPPPPIPPVFPIACQNNDECPFDNPCVNKLCLDSCHPGICGENADCVTIETRPSCECPPGTTGNPTLKCTALQTEEHTTAVPPIGEQRVPVVDLPDCVIKGNNTSCVCPPGTTGNPTLKCTTMQSYEHTALPPIVGPGIPVVDQPINPRTEPPSPRLPPLALTTTRSPVVIRFRPVPPPPLPPFIPISCQNNDECTIDNTCVNKLCYDACGLVLCGDNADCMTFNHRPVCMCPYGTTGNPALKCSALALYITGKVN